MIYTMLLLKVLCQVEGILLDTRIVLGDDQFAVFTPGKFIEGFGSWVLGATISGYNSLYGENQFYVSSTTTRRGCMILRDLAAQGSVGRDLGLIHGFRP